MEHERERVRAAVMLVIREMFAMNAALQDISRKSRMKHTPSVQVGYQQSYLRSFSHVMYSHFQNVVSLKLNLCCLQRQSPSMSF